MDLTADPFSHERKCSMQTFSIFFYLFIFLCVCSGHMLQHINIGMKVKQCAHQIPSLLMEASIQPITRTVLRVRLVITPDFRWHDQVTSNHTRSQTVIWDLLSTSHNYWKLGSIKWINTIWFFYTLHYFDIYSYCNPTLKVMDNIDPLFVLGNRVLNIKHKNILKWIAILYHFCLSTSIYWFKPI